MFLRLLWCQRGKIAVRASAGPMKGKDGLDMNAGILNFIVMDVGIIGAKSQSNVKPRGKGKE